MALSEGVILEQLNAVIDPELFINIVDLGLSYEIDIQLGDEEKKNIAIDMTMTSPMCPAGPQLVGQSKQVLGQLQDVGEVEVKIVLDPPWSPDRITNEARDQLGIFKMKRGISEQRTEQLTDNSENSRASAPNRIDGDMQERRHDVGTSGMQAAG